MGVTLQLGDLEFSGRGGSGSRWYFRRLKDWVSLSDSKSEVIERPQQHGAFGIGEDFRSSLTVSFDGLYKGASRLDALQKRDMLKGLAAAQGSMRMSLDDEDGRWGREVSLRRIDIEDIRNQRVLTFQVYVVATDPRLYGEVVSVSTGLPVTGGGLTWPITYPITWGAGGSSGRVLVVNGGTADTSPLLEVTGGLSEGFTIDEVGTGRQVRFDRLIPLGSTIYMDPRTGTAYIDAPGNDVGGFLTRTEWPTVPRQGQTILQFNKLGTATGTPTLTARSAPAKW